ncbi:putative isomerase YbhE [Trametes coccinea BRFM310]|uniref:Putative isomerase YbhE n=1 Tax=Trametes coccinea (strain BRFM310) TaxID=1353009 RepID=A0A1Y2J3R1_TRAC3|nr:putative isomerase YbhE [Trametes coccinea BRFM310]
MVNFTILAGGYSTFIATYLFNSDANTLSLLGQFPTGQNPSWIDLHPTNKSILYATNENADGALQSFFVKQDGSLTAAIGQTSSGGNGPAFAVPLSTGEVAVMNFGSGNGLVVPTEEDPLEFTEGAPLISFPAAVSHPHMALEVGEEVFVPDLGADTIWRLARSGGPGQFQIHGQIDQPKGSGPRHVVVRGDQLYTVHELSSTLTQQTIPSTPAASAPALVANFSVVPPGLPAGASMAAGEILLAEGSAAPGSPFSQPFIYVSNRNVGVQDPRGDAIAIYAVEPQLRFVKHVFTGLDQIRGMELSGGEENEFLVAAGVAGDAGVVVLRRTQGGADLEIVATNKDVPTRSSFVWLD